MAKIDELMATPTGTPEPAQPVEPGPAVRARIRFEACTSAYPARGRRGARGASTSTCTRARRVALVGETGAGKSTIVKLVARFYDADRRAGAGRRRSGRRARPRRVPPPARLRPAGGVPVLRAPIRDNIAYGRPDATDAEVERAARAVGAHDFIAAPPGRLPAPVSERGRSLSAGQRQLIASPARCSSTLRSCCSTRRPSNLDLATEARVQRAMGIVARRAHDAAHRPPAADGPRPPTASSWSTTAASSSRAPTTSCSRAAVATPSCGTSPRWPPPADVAAVPRPVPGASRVRSGARARSRPARARPGVCGGGRYTIPRSRPTAAYCSAWSTSGPTSPPTREAQVRRRDDLGRDHDRSPRSARAAPRTLCANVAGVTTGEVPVLREAGDGAERPLLAAAADADRRMGLLDRLGLAASAAAGAGTGRRSRSSPRSAGWSRPRGSRRRSRSGP